MCLEESFCPFTRDALNFQQPKIYDAPPSSVQVTLPQPSSLRRVTLRSIIQLPPMLTGKAESGQITCRQERSM